MTGGRRRAADHIDLRFEFDNGYVKYSTTFESAENVWSSNVVEFEFELRHIPRSDRCTWSGVGQELTSTHGSVVTQASGRHWSALWAGISLESLNVAEHSVRVVRDSAWRDLETSCRNYLIIPNELMPLSICGVSNTPGNLLEISKVSWKFSGWLKILVLHSVPVKNILQ